MLNINYKSNRKIFCWGLGKRFGKPVFKINIRKHYYTLLDNLNHVKDFIFVELRKDKNIKIFLLSFISLFIYISMMDVDSISQAESDSDSKENQLEEVKIPKKYIFLGCIVLIVIIILFIKSGNDISSVTDNNVNIGGNANAEINAEINVDKKVDNILNYIKNNEELMKKINKTISEEGINNLKR